MTAEHEYFQILAYRWDITKARQMAAGLPVHYCKVEPWFGWLSLIQIDEDHLQAADLDKPLLMAAIRELGGHMILDGWHRLAKARHEGITDLPVITLDERQGHDARIHGGDKGLPFIH